MNEKIVTKALAVLDSITYKQMYTSWAIMILAAFSWLIWLCHFDFS